MLAYGFRSDGVEKQEKQSKNETMKPKTRRHHTSKSDEPDVQESAFLKKIIAYQRKLLVWTAYSFSLSSSYHYYYSYYTTSQSIALKNTFLLIFWFLLQNYFARNFYNMRMLALFVAFAINFILLFYKVTVPRMFL